MERWYLIKEYRLYSVIAFFLVAYSKGREMVICNDIFYFRLPKWLIRILFIVDVKKDKINLASLIYQVWLTVSVILFIIIYFIGLNPLVWMFSIISVNEPIGNKPEILFIIYLWGGAFFIAFPVMIYSAICDKYF